jgi:hypothetical protein
MSDELPTQPVHLNTLELGWLWQAVARALYLKFKAAAIANGVVWYYADPWPIEAPKDGNTPP